jgi:hypothetical protein
MVLLAELSGRFWAARDVLAAGGLAPGNLGWVPAGSGGLPRGLHASLRVPDEVVCGLSVARLARWIALAELWYDPGAREPPPDCALRARGAFTARHWRLGPGLVSGLPGTGCAECGLRDRRGV